MAQAPQIQPYVIVSIGIFLAFAGILFYLLVNLLAKQALLRRARAQLQEYSVNLEQMVEDRTSELKASEEKYRNLYENSQEAILVVRRATEEILQTNSEASALFGHEPQRLLEMRFRDLIATELSMGAPQGWEELLIRRPDGSGRYIDCLFGDITYEGESCWQVLCRDITQRRELEVHLLQSMKMAALGQLAAGVAHELNTPLNTLYSSAYFIREQTSNPSPKVHKHFELIETEIGRCRRIINDLLKFSRSPAPTLELVRTDVNALLENSLGLMGKEILVSGIQVVKEIQNLPLIMIDPSRMIQVFSNLVQNAVQAMPSGGQLTIKTWADADQNPPVGPPQNGSGRRLYISVEDTGAGIPAPALTQIFIPFFTTKKSSGGVGLGLAVSHEIIKQFKGEIKVESEVGRGSRFTISLPLER